MTAGRVNDYPGRAVAAYIIIGFVATVIMYVLSAVSFKLRLIAPMSPRLIGRWFASMGRGQFLHSDIGQTAAINHERAIAVPVHYAIGVTLALIYLFACASLGLASRKSNYRAGLRFVYEHLSLAGHVSFHGIRLVWQPRTARNAIVPQ